MLKKILLTFVNKVDLMTILKLEKWFLILFSHKAKNNLVLPINFGIILRKTFIFAQMNSHKYIKLSVALLLILVMQIASASISSTGTSDEKMKNNKYSLKKFNSLRHTFSIYALKSRLRYTNSDIISQFHTSEGLSINSMMSYDKGNTTYIMPYKYKVRIPKFKTPTPNY
jgi:hypothetical protein